MPLPCSDTRVTYPDGDTSSTGTVLHVESLADGRAAVLLDATAFHPVDTRVARPARRPRDDDHDAGQAIVDAVAGGIHEGCSTSARTCPFAQARTAGLSSSRTSSRARRPLSATRADRCRPGTIAPRSRRDTPRATSRHSRSMPCWPTRGRSLRRPTASAPGVRLRSPSSSRASPIRVQSTRTGSANRCAARDSRRPLSTNSKASRLRECPARRVGGAGGANSHRA